MAKGWIIAIVVILVLAFLFIGMKGSFLGPGGEFAAKIIKPSQVTVSGSVSTTGTGTYPQSITFISNSGAPYVGSISGKTYEVVLPNVNTYSVKIKWAALGITGGECNAGTLDLDSIESSATYSWSC